MTAVDAAYATVMRRRSIALAAPLIHGGEVDRLHHAVREDRRAFDSQVASWAYVFTALTVMRVVAEVRLDARADSLELQSLQQQEKRAARRVKVKTPANATAGGRPNRRGRKNETALRDLVIHTLLHLYPDRGRATQRWHAAVTFAALAWKGLPAVDDLQRDMRRRARLKSVDSREFDYFNVQLRRRLQSILSSSV